MQHQVDHYSLEVFLGKGSYASVYQGKCIKTLDKVAIKIVKFDSYDDLTESFQSDRFVALPDSSTKYVYRFIETKFVQQEIKILLQMKEHPNIIKFHKAYQCQNYIFFIMELAEGKTLETIVETEKKIFKVSKAESVCRQLCEAVMHCHKSGIAHRDIKLENIIYDESTETIKLIDFGLSIFVKIGGLSYDFCGTPHFNSPEVTLTRPHYPQIADIWSVGVCIYTILCGKLPFNAEHFADLCNLLRHSEPKYPAHIPDHVVNLLKGFLNKDPSKRISLEEALKVKWM